VTETTDPISPRRPAPAAHGRRTTLRAVAAHAHVSTATVSKVVNGRSDVGEQTRARVEEAISELGYVSLGERQSSLYATHEMTIELIVDPDIAFNPYLATFLTGAMEKAAAEGAALVVRSFETLTDVQPVVWAQNLTRAGRTGVIEITSEYSRDREVALSRVGLPMVLVDPIDVPRTETPSIGATNWAGGYEATKHLLNLGHTRIRFIGGPPGARCDIVRAHGWAAAMSEAGLAVDAADIPRESYSFDHGLEAATAMLCSAEPPTAIFAGNDTCATGVVEAARRLGIEVPGGLSVVGFDDTVLAQVSTPRLTTVHQPIADIGRSAVGTVVSLARGESLVTKRVELATHLVVRESTAPPLG